MLSGGERARLALAKLLIRPANLLLLDEPTNHLDLRSREVLEEALNEYGGSFVVVSHDRYFINRVVTSIGEVCGGRIALHPGDYDEYLEWTARRAAEAETAAPELAGAPAEAGDGAQARRQARRREAEERNQRYRARREVETRLEPIETEIAELEQRQRELEQAQADPAVYTDPERAAETARARARTAERLESLYAAWEAIAADLPAE